MHSTNIGASSLISRFKGAGKVNEPLRVIVEATIALAIFSLIFIGFFYSFSEVFFIWMGLDKETIKLALDFFKYFIWGIPVLYIFAFQGYIFNAHGDTRISNWIMLFTLIINIILDPFFIFGLYFFPEMGISGAAFVTVASQLLGILLRGYYLSKKGYMPSWQLFKVQKRFTYLKEILSIGIPVSLSSLVWTLVFPALTVIITKFGMEPLAGVNIGHRFEGIPYFLGEAFAIASTSLVGQAFGRGDTKEIRAIMRNGLGIITFILFFISLIFIFFSYELVSILNSDPAIIQHAGDYLKIVGYFEIFLGWEMILEGGFNGLGASKIQMWIRVPLTLMRVPLAYYLAFSTSLGVAGIWWAVSISTLLKGLVLLWVWNSRTNYNNSTDSSRNTSLFYDEADE